MKKVFKSAYEVIHLFAQRTQHEARCSNVFFYGNEIYSYGNHYLLGRFYDTPKGTYIYINDKGYSHTTAKHVKILMSATSQYKQFFETDINERIVYDYMYSMYEKLKRARKKEEYIYNILEKYNKYKKYLEFINEKEEDIYINPQIKIIYEAVEKIKNENAKYDDDVFRRILEAKQEDEKYKRYILKQKFLNYEIDFVPQLPIIKSPDIIRLSKGGSYIQTSQGVRISLGEAKRVYEKLKSKTLQVDDKIKDYTVLYIDDEKIKVGCHWFLISELIEFGDKLFNTGSYGT